MGAIRIKVPKRQGGWSGPTGEGTPQNPPPWGLNHCHFLLNTHNCSILEITMGQTAVFGFRITA